MRTQRSILKALMLLALAATLSGCEGDENKNPGLEQPSRPELASPATKCLRQHPAMQVRSFSDSVSAVKAFFRASVDCRPTERELDSFSAWLETRGVRIEQVGGGQ